MRALAPALALIIVCAAAGPCLAQPIIIPLDGNDSKPKAPEASAPPVAPPQAGPSIPNDVASAPDQGGREVAAQPAPRN